MNKRGIINAVTYAYMLDVIVWKQKGQENN